MFFLIGCPEYKALACGIKCLGTCLERCCVLCVCFIFPNGGKTKGTRNKNAALEYWYYVKGAKQKFSYPKLCCYSLGLVEKLGVFWLVVCGS